MGDAGGSGWLELETAAEDNAWFLAEDKLLQLELQRLSDRILARASRVGDRCEEALRLTGRKVVEVDVLLNSLERISTTQFVESVSASLTCDELLCAAPP